MPPKKKTSKPKFKGGPGHPARHVGQSDYTEDQAVIDQVIAGSAKTAEIAGIATLEESVLSGAIEASLLSSQENEDPLQHVAQDDDVLLAAINEAQFGGGIEECPHVKDAVKPAQFRRLITKHRDWDHCQGCLNDHTIVKRMAQTLDTAVTALALADMSGDPTEGLPADLLWMCLSCCEVNCGRALKKHAIVHHDKTKKDHPVAINLASLDCWCYECNDQLATSKNKNPAAQACQSLLGKILLARQSKAREVSVALAKKSKGAAVAPVATKARIFTPGLQNLGNTCFFNSVMQVLVETRSLKVILGDKNQSEFPTSLSAITEKGLGPLTTTFKDFLFTMWRQQGGIVTPRDLFTQIAKKWKVFRGFREQDSQELMRHLFDGIRLEEMDLIKKVVAGESASSSSELHATNSRDEPPKYVPFIDSCFSGKLVSVIVCQSCKKCSYSYEDYFDLSLPVKGAPLEVGGGSLMELLRARSRAAGVEVSLTPDADDKYPISKEDQGSEAHLKHVEKLLKNVSAKSSSDTLSIERSLNQFTSVDCLEGENKFACENCYELIKSYGQSVQDNESWKERPIIAPKEKHQTEMEGAVDETKVDAEEEEDGSKENTSESDSDGDALDGARHSDSKASIFLMQPIPESQHILRKAYKRYLISSLPPTLVLHLKRFEQSASRFGLMRKIEDQVDIPVEIDMSPYCIPKGGLEDEDAEGEDSEKEGQKASKKYRLYGATVHQGSLATGHYSNYVLSSKVELPAPTAVHNKPLSLAPPVSAPDGIDMPDVPLEELLAQQSQKRSGGKKKRGGQAKKGGDAPSAAKPGVDRQPSSGADTLPVGSGSLGEDAVTDEQPDSRQWIHCSDMNVRLATLQEVLASRPYLLYYERC